MVDRGPQQHRQRAQSVTARQAPTTRAMMQARKLSRAMEMAAQQAMTLAKIAV
jgi:hypothetical protein